MHDFALDANGDVRIENNEISIVVGDDLLHQKVLTVMRTNLGEWFFDWEHGIDFDNLIGKNTSEDLARYEIERGLLQVDNTSKITEFSYTADKVARQAKVVFKAINESGEEVGGEVEWA